MTTDIEIELRLRNINKFYSLEIVMWFNQQGENFLDNLIMDKDKLSKELAQLRDIASLISPPKLAGDPRVENARDAINIANKILKAIEHKRGVSLHIEKYHQNSLSIFNHARKPVESLEQYFTKIISIISVKPNPPELK